jgi:integrase
VRRAPIAGVLEPAEVEASLAALRTRRDRALVEATLLGGLRRWEVLSLRLEDLHLGGWQGVRHQRQGWPINTLSPISQTFFTHGGGVPHDEHPLDAAPNQVFVALKGPRRGEPLSAAGLDELLTAAGARADWLADEYRRAADAIEVQALVAASR